MKNSVFLFLAAFCVYQRPVLAQTNFDKLISEAAVKKSDLTVFISEAAGSFEKEIYKNNAQTAMMPASVTKLVTTAAFLKNQPLGVKFKTQILKDKNITEGVLKGPLYFKGGGDPAFVSENMW